MTKALQVRLALACSLLLVTIATGCSSRPSEVVSEGEYLVFQPFAIGQTGSFTSIVEAVYRDEVSWNAVKDSLNVMEPFGSVDFSQSMIVLIAMPKEQGGYSIEVSSVEKTDDGIVVEYVVDEPASDCIPVVGTSLPFQVVKVAMAEGPVHFERSVEPYRCTWKQ